MIRIAIAGLLLASAASAEPEQAGHAIESIGVFYRVDGPIGTSAESLSVIRPHGDGYAYETYSRGLGLARLMVASDMLESTRFLLDDDGMVRPLAYSCRSCNRGKEGLVEITYDWQTGIASYSEAEEKADFELKPRAMDRKAWEIQTMLELGAGRTLDVQPTLERGKLKLYNGQRMGEETLATAFGEMETVKYLRQREGSENFQYIWYARELGWLPARWELWRKDRRTATIEASSYAWGEGAALAMRQDWLDK